MPEFRKYLELLVGVVGFEPTTPASRTYRPAPYSSQFQILSTTADDWAGALFTPFEPLAFKLRARAAEAVEFGNSNCPATQTQVRLREGER
jgi:hypothetical protein